MENKIIGFKPHRLKQDDDYFKAEVALNNAFNKRDDWDLIIFGGKGDGWQPKDFLSEREKMIAVSTIQWLGTPVGKSFLEQCGFKYVG
jgi:hypothetical protein